MSNLRFIIPFLLSLHLGATDAVDQFNIPAWILPSILQVESRSHYRPNGTIEVGDSRRGAAGERGVFQCRPAAFREVARRGESFDRLSTDTAFAEQIAARYLLKLRARHGSWVNAIQSWNAGRPCPAGRRYLNKVYAATKWIR